jgi:hypothetical protein
MKILFRFSFLILSFSLLSTTISAQMGGGGMDFEINSRIVGNHNTDASVKSIGFNKSLFNIMLKKGQKGVISTSLNYTYAHLNYNIENSIYDLSQIKDFHSLGINISYFRMINQKWSFIGMFNPQLSSNFAGSISGDDLFFNAVAIFNYSSKRTNRLSFGVVYSNTMGVPFPIPVISYWKKLSDKWEMNLGIPRMNLSHHLSQKSTVSTYIEFDGYNLNISKSIQDPLLSQRLATQINYVDIISGIEYQLSFEKFLFKLNVGYTLGREFELQNSERETALKFDMANNWNIGIGLGFKF